MRNKYPGNCYRCGEWVETGEGHFERHKGGWRVQHANCAIIHRAEPRQTTPSERTKTRAARRRKQRAALEASDEG